MTRRPPWVVAVGAVDPEPPNRLVQAAGGLVVPALLVGGGYLGWTLSHAWWGAALGVAAVPFVLFPVLYLGGVALTGQT